MELLGALNFLDTITKMRPYVKFIVLEFYSNIKKGMDDPTSLDFQRIYVRGHHFVFSPSILNNYLGYHDLERLMTQPNIQRVVLVFTGGIYFVWHDKGNVPSFIMSTKYSILHKIRIFN